MWAMKPTPQASCSLAGSYRPCFWGRSIFFSSNDTQDHALGGHVRPCPQASADKPNAHKKAGRARTGFVLCTNLVQKQQSEGRKSQNSDPACTNLDTRA